MSEHDTPMINKVSPAFSEPLHVGRPNIGSPEAFLNLAAEILERRWLTNNGPLVQELERRLAAFLGVKHCVAMCNGTIALEIAIRALSLRARLSSLRIRSSQPRPRCTGRGLLRSSPISIRRHTTSTRPPCAV